MGRTMRRRMLWAGVALLALAGVGLKVLRNGDASPPNPWKHASLDVLSFPGCYASAISPDGKSIGLSCHKPYAMIWREGKPIRRIEGEGNVSIGSVTDEGDVYGSIRTKGILAVRWTPEGKLVVPKVNGARNTGWGPRGDDGNAILNFADRGSPWVVARDGTAKPFTLDGAAFDGRVTHANADLSEGVGRDRKTPFYTDIHWRHGRAISQRIPGAKGPRLVGRSKDGKTEFFQTEKGAEAFRNGVQVGLIPNPPLPVMPLRDQAEEEWKKRTATGLYYMAKFRPSAQVNIRKVSRDGRMAYGDQVASYDGPKSVPFVYREGDGFWPFRQILSESGHSLEGWEKIEISAMSPDGLVIAGSVRKGATIQPFVVRLR